MYLLSVEMASWGILVMLAVAAAETAGLRW